MSTEIVYAKCSLKYIKWYHRIYLWLFRRTYLTEFDAKDSTLTILHIKWVFNHMFILMEEVKKFECSKCEGI